MVRVAGFRGALLNPTRVDVAKIAAAPVPGVRSLLAKQDLVRDTHLSVYRYHQSFAQRGRTVTRKTVLVAVELQPWSTGAIRAHEQTSRMARELATRGISTEAAHTEAVFCGYRDRARDVDQLLGAIEKQQPALHVTTADRTVHTLWRESDPDVIGTLQTLLAATPLHVLDGNGRYEGMLAYRTTGMLGYREDLGGAKLAPLSTANYGLACLVNIEDPALEVVPRHRVIRDGGSRVDVLTAAKQWLAIERIAGAAEDFAKQRAALAELGSRPGFLALFPSDPDAWRLTLLPTTTLDSRQAIDPVVVEEVFLARVVRANARSVLDASTVVKAVADGGIGVILRPITIDNVLRADELGELLPFGSTAFAPSLARLVTYLIDPNEMVS
jgi:uncharacterized protein (DUF1015 family)